MKHIITESFRALLDIMCGIASRITGCLRRQGGLTEKTEYKAVENTQRWGRLGIEAIACRPNVAEPTLFLNNNFLE